LRAAARAHPGVDAHRFGAAVLADRVAETDVRAREMATAAD